MRQLLRPRGLLACFFACAAFARADSVFPLWKAPEVADRPVYGTGVTWYGQKQDYALDRLTFAVPGGFPPVGRLDTENRASSIAVRPNLWLLPFLQVYGLVGRVESKTLVKNVPLIGQVSTKDTGTFYGGGATLAYGRGDWFGLVDANYSYADMNSADSSIRTLVVEPRIGRRFGRAALWLGAMYQDTEETTAGVFPLTGLGDVPYSVKLKTADAWNAHAGALWAFSKHVSLVGDIGFGARKSYLVSLEFAW